MAKDPAFLFYSSDFMSGTLLFSWQEKGHYIMLLCVMHQQGRLSLPEIEIVLQGNPTIRVLTKFKIDEDGKYYNERLESEQAKRKTFTESRRNSLNINDGDMVHIYLLLDKSSGNHKIGSSKYPLMRLTDLQKKNEHVVMFWNSENLIERINEKQLHIHFKDKKVRNDWFKLSEIDIDYIKKHCRTKEEIKHRTELRTVLRTVLRTELRTENENENDNENRNDNEFSKGGMGETQKYKDIVSSTIWLQTIAMQKKLSGIKTSEYLEDFLNDLWLKEEFSKPEREIKKHFINWLNIELRKSPKHDKAQSKFQKANEDLKEGLTIIKQMHGNS